MFCIGFALCILFGQGYGLPPPCDSEIYCTGDFLKLVQTAKIYKDDKYFVDTKLMTSPELFLETFHNWTAGLLNPSEALEGFLSYYVGAPGSELEPWTPKDWGEKPSFLSKIKNPKLQAWAKQLHHLWKSLGRKNSDTYVDPERHSLIYTPYPVIIPGGRFRELYYWDSYWIINGLLVSDMWGTAQGMINNFLFLVDRYGFVPNGGRIYYERRSQPPFLTQMVQQFFNVTESDDFLRKALPTLEKEYNFWMLNRSITVEVDGRRHVLNHYSVQVDHPRPESYTDDLDLAESLSEEEKTRLYTELKAGAESGWDFSSRWFFSRENSSHSTLKDIHTSAFIPTDLNSLMCLNEYTLAEFHQKLGNEKESQRFLRAYQNRLAAVEAVLWNPKHGVWFDYNLHTNSSNTAFYLSNLSPLWARCFTQQDMQLKAFKYLKESGALSYPHGVPTSLVASGEQWDYPNAWAPLQQMLIRGLSEIPSDEAKQVAFELAQKWIKSNWETYNTHNAMFEKYDVNDGKPGGGGEYNVQLGFGWTNGVALQLLHQYGDRLNSAGGLISNQFLLLILLLLMLLLLE